MSSITCDVIESPKRLAHLPGQQEMSMNPLPRLQSVLPWLLTLSTWLLAKNLNMPEPLVHAAGLVVLAQVETFENSVGRSLCLVRLARRFRAWWRRLG
jgi:hypothetical protein